MVHLLSSGLLLVLAGAWGLSCNGGSTTANDQASTTSPPSFREGERICLSLRVLQERAEAALASRRSLDERLENLAGIGWLEGFAVDTETSDVILIGLYSQKRPTLHLDDLVVNLRNVVTREVEPYCSLDPQEENVAKVSRLFQDRGVMQEREQLYHAFLRLKEAWGPQQVVVGGVPRNSRHAHVMIDADYHMKRVSQGLVELPGVASCPERLLAAEEQKLQAVQTSATSGLSMSRFWFHIAEGHPTFLESKGIVWLTNCTVVVLTERQMATAEGKLRDAGGDDPHAQGFARDLSEKFSQATAVVAAYAELENLYRLSALLRSMEFRNAAGQAQIDFAFFLRQYRCQTESAMPNSLPGLVNYKEKQGYVQQGDTALEYVLFPMVCGGVGMEMKLEPKQFVMDDSGRLQALRSAALRSRPQRDALCWAIGPL
jgi:hypothetical protein